MKSTETAVIPDNLQSISGIGSAAEKALHTHNIYFFSEIAARSPEALYELTKGVKGMTVKRIRNEDWPGQAGKLLNAQTVKEPSESGNGQHYADYHIKLLLEADNQVRYTSITCLQHQKEKVWAGWDAPKVITFIEEHTNPKPIPSDPEQKESELPVTTSMINLEPLLEKTTPILHKLALFRPHTEEVSHMLNHEDNPWIQFETELPGWQEAEIPAEVKVFARDLSINRRTELGKVSEKVMHGLWGTKLSGNHLAAGIYRLEAELNIETAPGCHTSHEPLQGDILIVI